MSSTNNNSKKITFRYYSDVLEEETVETMWAEIIDEKNGIYKLDNIPFYGPQIASDDVFFAEYDNDEKALVFRNVIEHSGNSIIQVIVLETDFDKEIIRQELKNLDCLSEGLNEKYFVIEISKEINYKKIKSLLNNYENNGVISYAEPLLSKQHQIDIENE